MVRTRLRKEMANAPSWAASPAGLSRDTLLEAVREMLTWSAAFCAYEDGLLDGDVFRVRHVLRTKEMLAEVVKLLLRHAAERKRRVREARIARLLPKLVELLASPPLKGGKVDIEKTKEFVRDAFSEERLLLSKSAAGAVAALALPAVLKGEKPGTMRHSQKVIAAVLKKHGQVKCSFSTLTNYRYALEKGSKGRKGAAVRGDLTMTALLDARHMDSASLVRFAVLAVAGKGNEELARGMSWSFKHLPDARERERAEWF